MSRPLPALSLAVLLVGCPRPDDGSDPDTDDTPDTDSDTDATDTPVDTGERPPVEDPSWWGGALVDLSAPFAGDDGFPVDAGQPSPFREPQAMGAFFADLDEDGTPEVVTSTSGFAGPDAAEHRVWRLQAGALALDTTWTDRIDDTRWGWLGAVDLDGDGHLDLISEAAGELVSWGDGTGFGPPDGVSTPPQFGLLYGALVWDVDRDGWLDLVLGQRGCGDNVLFVRQVAPRQLEVDATMVDDPGPPTIVELVGVVPRAPDPDLHVLVGSAIACDPPLHPGFLVPGDDGLVATDALPPETYWKLQPESAGQPVSALTPMGATTTDLDDDGVLDLLLSLGDGRVGVFPDEDGTLGDATLDHDIGRVVAGDAGGVWFPWAMETLDLDRDGRKDVLTAIGDDAGSFHAFQDFPTTNLAWWGAADGSFVDVTAAIGLDAAVGSWHGLVLDDLDGDLDPDLLLAGYGDRPLLYRNDLAPDGAALVLRLTGTTSNPAAYGARVAVSAGGRTQHHLHGAIASPGGLGRRALFLGVGEATEADVSVTWPSGWTQSLPGLSAERAHDLVEPVTLEVVDEERSAPADGTSRILVRLTPRDAAGRPDATASPSVQLVGDGTLVGSPVRVDDAWEVEVQAPAAPGEVRIVAGWDDVTLQVQPRIRWLPTVGD